MGGQLPVTCERCDICTVTGEGTSFWNTVRHSFTINLVLAVFLREVPIRTYVMSNTTNQFVTSEGKRSISKRGFVYCIHLMAGILLIFPFLFYSVDDLVKIIKWILKPKLFACSVNNALSAFHSIKISLV